MNKLQGNNDGLGNRCSIHLSYGAKRLNVSRLGALGTVLGTVEPFHRLADVVQSDYGIPIKHTSRPVSHHEHDLSFRESLPLKFPRCTSSQVVEDPQDFYDFPVPILHAEPGELTGRSPLLTEGADLYPLPEDLWIRAGKRQRNKEKRKMRGRK